MEEAAYFYWGLLVAEAAAETGAAAARNCGRLVAGRASRRGAAFDVWMEGENWA